MLLQELLLRAHFVFKDGDDEAFKASRCLNDLLALLQRGRLLVLLDDLSELGDTLDQYHILHELLNRRLSHSILVCLLADFEYGLFRSFAHGLPQNRAEHHCFHVSDLLL